MGASLELREQVRQMLERLREILKAGPPDRFRSRLRVLITELLHGKGSLAELAEGLRPLLKDIALGFLEAGNVRGCRLALSALRQR